MYNALAYHDLSGCCPVFTSRADNYSEVVRMDFTPQPKACLKHSNFEICIEHDDDTGKVVYQLNFTHPAYRLICYDPFDSATEAVLVALRELGEIKTP